MMAMESLDGREKARGGTKEQRGVYIAIKCWREMIESGATGSKEDAGAAVSRDTLQDASIFTVQWLHEAGSAYRDGVAFVNPQDDHRRPCVELREHDPRLGAYLSNAAPLFLLQCYLHHRLWLLERPTTCTHLYRPLSANALHADVCVPPCPPPSAAVSRENYAGGVPIEGKCSYCPPPSTLQCSFARTFLAEGEKRS